MYSLSLSLCLSWCLQPSNPDHPYFYLNSERHKTSYVRGKKNNERPTGCLTGQVLRLPVRRWNLSPETSLRRLHQREDLLGGPGRLGGIPKPGHSGGGGKDHFCGEQRRRSGKSPNRNIKGESVPIPLSPSFLHSAIYLHTIVRTMYCTLRAYLSGQHLNASSSTSFLFSI